VFDKEESWPGGISKTIAAFLAPSYARRLATPSRARITAAGREENLREMSGVDIFSYELVEALSRPGCPVCRVMESSEVRDMTNFVREGWQDARASLRFVTAGGFCRSHAWLFHGVAAEAHTGVAIAHLYGRLLAQDLDVAQKISGRLLRPSRLCRSRRRELASALQRRMACPACVAAEDGVRRSATFLVNALDSPKVRRLFETSDGLCHRHFTLVFEDAVAKSRETALFLLRDWQRRLGQVAHDLAEYDRKRDYRYAAERTPADQESWREVIRRYVGETPALVAAKGSEHGGR
jgi:hypothetical protein